MEPPRGAGAIRTAIAVILLLAGLAAFGLWRVLSGTERLPWAAGASPARFAQVDVGRSYSLAVPGGVRAMLAHGVPVAGSSSGQLISLQCTWTSPQTSDTQALTVSAESTSTKAENTVGHFAAPITGKIHVDCDGWGSMFIPDSVDRPADWSGWALLIAMVALTGGASLAVSEIRLAWERSRVLPGNGLAPTSQDDEIERFVDVTPIGGDDDEVPSSDRGDVAP